MKLLRWVLAGLVGVVLMLMLPMAAAAAVSYADSLSGYEYYATSTEGRFAGQASGALPGAWSATVDHTPLSPSATVTGGNFALATVLNGRAVTVTGDVHSGWVTRTNPGSTGCVNQTYDVHLDLIDVGATSHLGTGTFGGTLVHRRYSVLGQCVTYAASISGSLSLTF
jgi:hypothetical protein